MTIPEKFLRDNNQGSRQINAETALKDFGEEMKAGLLRDGEVLPMVPAMLGVQCFPSDKKYLLIDVGGTNLRTAKGSFCGGVPQIEKVEKFPMPVGRLSAKQYYGAIAEGAKRLLDETSDVGLCFSYNFRSEPSLDGVLTCFAKEIDAPEVVGTKVGASTIQSLADYPAKKRDVAVVNDTVAVLLGGAALAEGEYSGYVGYVYGTGTNIAYLENAENVAKMSDYSGDKVIINVEAGGFDKFLRGTFDLAVANDTAEPEAQKFEKAVSGKYLPQVAYKCLAQYAADGLFAEETSIKPFELKEMSDFLYGEQNSVYNYFSCSADRTAAKELCREVVDRAAKMGAVVVAAAAKRSASPMSDAPVLIVCEGTTFSKLTGYRANFEKYLDSLLGSGKYRIFTGDNLTLTGALAAISCKCGSGGDN